MKCVAVWKFGRDRETKQGNKMPNSQILQQVLANKLFPSLGKLLRGELDRALTRNSGGDEAKKEQWSRKGRLTMMAGSMGGFSSQKESDCAVFGKTSSEGGAVRRSWTTARGE